MRVKAGDTVVLNAHGHRQIFGATIPRYTRLMRVLKVSKQSLTEPEKTYEVRVDDPEINQYMIDDRCFDVAAPIPDRAYCPWCGVRFTLRPDGALPIHANADVRCHGAEKYPFAGG